MTPKAGTDLIAERVQHERAWAYSAWMARMTWGSMRQAANLPPERGGLGYDLSESALKGLVEQAKVEHGDLTMPRADRLERQSAELDVQAAGARADYDEARRLRGLRKPKRRDYYDPVEYMAAVADWYKARAEAAKIIESVDRRLDAIHRREAALHGLDAPAEAKVEVTHRDATDAAIAELADDLEKLARGQG